MDKQNFVLDIDTIFFSLYFNDVINFETFNYFTSQEREVKIHILNNQLPNLVKEWVDTELKNGRNKDEVKKIIETLHSLTKYFISQR